ncbi:hypothetical protein C9374_006089 [Naegleria lovaniensis]|uniref:Uncharacterized protein n=1 Tax=Naegleria lovaniensis TaxID=51637 RepID=A0AA88GPJ1_NAELO|nr:uncharacterized protein C9374_006089 [Naegleria lovaniensis]KAG2381705.1 hypothetical protein C9374_006089 [Naegleria lovaniensis]
MGVPGFIYWLETNILRGLKRQQHKQQLQHDDREPHEDIETIQFPIPNKEPNVEKIIKRQVDNFYIDLNGLIHPCCHPQVGKKPQNEDEMLQRIVDELLFLARTVSPKNLFFIAVDGVAPAAKQEQQRHRRFVAVNDHEIRSNYIGQIQEQKNEDVSMQEKKESNNDEQPSAPQGFLARLEAKKTHWDHNVISPGTPFMVRCMETVHRAADLIVQEFPNVKVIVSDSSVPGEGEHKILSYMKKEKAINPKSFSHMVHVVHGLDADLIMLTSLIGLPHIYSYRDKENIRDKRREKEIFDISALGRLFARIVVSSIITLDKTRKAREVAWSNENLVSDVVLLLMAVGNDFLPNIPSLVMHNHAASIIMFAYSKYLIQCLATTKGKGSSIDPSAYYLVDHKQGVKVNIRNFVKALASIRDESVFGLFVKMYSSNLRKATEKQAEDVFQHEDIIDGINQIVGSRGHIQDAKFDKVWKEVSKNSISHDSYETVYKILKDFYMSIDKKNSSINQSYDEASILNRCLSNANFVLDEIPTSLILKYKKEIHKEYYEKKFGTAHQNLERNFLKDLQDEELIKEITTFEKGAPLTPYEQLLCILPKESMGNCLPQTYLDILNDERLDAFFPSSFKRDGNFSGIIYKAVSLLPSIDMSLVKSISKEIDPLLSPEEKQKNSIGHDVIYVATDSDVNQELRQQLSIAEKSDEPISLSFNQNSILSGMFQKIDNSKTKLIFNTIDPSITPSNVLHANVASYLYQPSRVSVDMAYKAHESTPVPRGRINVLLTRQLAKFSQVGTFVRESESDDLKILSDRSGSNASHKRKYNKDRNADGPRRKMVKTQNSSTAAATPQKGNQSSTTPQKDDEMEERKPIKAKRKKNLKKSTAASLVTIQDGQERTSVEEESEKKSIKTTKQPKQPTQPTISKAEKRKKKRQRQQANKKLKKEAATNGVSSSSSDGVNGAAVESTSNITEASSNTKETTTTLPQVARDKQKLKENTKDKLMALMNKLKK